MVGQPDRQEAEDQRPRLTPEPDVLVEDIQDEDQDQPSPAMRTNLLIETGSRESRGGTSLSHDRRPSGKRLIQLRCGLLTPGEPRKSCRGSPEEFCPHAHPRCLSLCSSLSLRPRALPIAAAQTAGTISGTVRRPEPERAARRHRHRAQSSTRRLQRTAVTGAEGRYVIPALPPGAYELRAELAGFKPHVRRGVQLTIAQALALNITLEVGGLTEEVDVTGRPPVINTSSAELSYLVGSDAIEQLPLNGRNYTDLALLQPGVLAYPASRRRLGRRARARDEHQRAGSALERLPARRHAAERLHERPGRQRGRHRARHRDDPRVPRRIQRLQRGVRPQLRRPDQRADQVGREHRATAASSSSTATTRSTRGTTSTPASSRTSTATSSAARSAGRSPGIAASSSSATKRSSSGSAARSQHGRARRQRATRHPAERSRWRSTRRCAPYLAEFPRANGPSLGQGLAAFTFPFNQRLDQHFAQGRIDYNLGAGNQFFARYTLDDTDQFLPTDYPQFPRNFISRNQFFTAEYRRVFSPSTLNTARLGFSRTRIGQNVQANTSTALRTFIAGRDSMGDIDIGGLRRFGPAELGQPAAGAERVQRSRTISCTRAGVTC